MKREKIPECTIEDYQRTLSFLQRVRARLDRDIIKNSQAQAEIRNKIKKLKDERRRADE